VVDKQIEDKLGGVKLKIEDMECLRAQIIGEKNGRKAEFIIDCIVGTHSRWGCGSGDVSTGVPPCIAAQMQVEGRIQPGVWGPEQAIEPEYFFKELAKREMRIQVTKKEDLT
jgi:saccharopine dehydrogenase-like NADP-dependent oxidoreductase